MVDVMVSLGDTVADTFLTTAGGKLFAINNCSLLI